MTSKFSKGDIVRITDKSSGFADPGEYEVISNFKWFTGTMYEVKSVDGAQFAVNEGMLALIRKAGDKPVAEELEDLFREMDEAVRLKSVDMLLEERHALKRQITTADYESTIRRSTRLAEIDEQLRVLTFKTGSVV